MALVEVCNQDFAQSSLDRGSSPYRNPYQRCVLCCPGSTGDVFTGPLAHPI